MLKVMRACSKAKDERSPQVMNARYHGLSSTKQEILCIYE